MNLFLLMPFIIAAIAAFSLRGRNQPSAADTLAKYELIEELRKIRG